MNSKFYINGELNDDVPQKIISVLTARNELKADDQIQCILGRTKFSILGVGPSIICTDKYLITFMNNGAFGSSRYLYSDIMSTTLNNPAYFKEIVITIDSKEIELSVGAFPKETDKLYQFLSSKIELNKHNHHYSNKSNELDDIKKLYELKELGIITENEFQIKKKQLLGI